MQDCFLSAIIVSNKPRVVYGTLESSSKKFKELYRDVWLFLAILGRLMKTCLVSSKAALSSLHAYKNHGFLFD